MNEEFDEIRPYYDEELPAVYDELIADPAFRQVVQLDKNAVVRVQLVGA